MFPGDYWVDLGGQWVHGEVGNVAFELAWPLGLIERGDIKSRDFELYDSSGTRVNQTMANDIRNFYFKTEVNLSEYAEKGNNGSIGEFYQNEYIDT